LFTTGQHIISTNKILNIIYNKISLLWYDMIYDDTIWYDMMIWYDIWYDMMIRYDIRYDTIWYDIFLNCNWVATRWQ
jgi:hypothetical protein